MKQKTIFILLALVMFLTIAFFYINNIFLPYKIKDIIAQKASEILHRSVAIGEIHFQPIKGFSLHNLRISERDNTEKSFAVIEEVHFNILLCPIFKNKNIITPSINLPRPAAHVERHSEKEWNF